MAIPKTVKTYMIRQYLGAHITDADTADVLEAIGQSVPEGEKGEKVLAEWDEAIATVTKRLLS